MNDGEWLSAGLLLSCCDQLHPEIELPPMRFPRPRLTVRRMMIAVLIAGFALQSGIMGWRWSVYRSLAALNERMEGETLKKLNFRMHHPEYCWARWVIPYERQLAEHYGSLKRKYEDAMTRPWLVVAPDPPEPEPK